MPDSSQGVAVSFAGSPLGSLTGFRCSAGQAQYSDVTSFASGATGSGDDYRVLKSYVCTAIEPGSAEVSMFGCPPYAPSDIGSRGTLDVGGLVSGEAYLEEYEVTGQVGEFLRGTARFRLSGGSLE